RGNIKDASTLIRRYFNIEYLDFSGVMALQNDILIIAIIKRSLNLRHLEISHNDIGDEVIEALAYTCHKLEHLELNVQGAQHRLHSTSWYKDVKKLENIVNRDRQKRCICQDNGIFLLEVWYDEKPEIVIPERIQKIKEFTGEILRLI
ncbi:15079_t:CDS:2, partial [Funneliformis geosporum]